VVVLAKQRGDDNAYVTVARGEARRLDGELERAESLFRDALATNAELALAHLGLALVEAARKQQLAALSSCDRAVDLAPGLLPALLLRVELRRQQRELPTAAAEADALVEAYPDVPQAWTARALVRLDQGQHDHARRDATQAIELDPELARGYVVRAKILVAMRDLRSALDDFTLALGRSARSGRPAADLLARRAFVLAQLGRQDEARVDLERARGMLEPGDPLVRSIDMMLRRLTPPGD
jgi:tetratricopeptide (TPR) repeat protein